jgi:NitT/TauT family transport system substrate-binding protein
MIKRRMLLAASLATPFSARAEGLIPIRYGSVGGTTDAAIFIADEDGFFRDAGLAIEINRLPNASALIASLATDQLDVAGISISPGLFAAVQRGIGLRVVGDKESILPNFMATQLVVRPSLPGADSAAALASLVGKKVAISARAASAFFLFGALAEKYGHSVSEFDFAEMEYPSMPIALSNQAVDGAVILEPFLTRAVSAGWARTVSDFTEIAPASGASEVPIVYAERFAANRALGEACMLAYTRAVRVYDDAFIKNIGKERILDLVARRTGFPIATIRDSNPVGFEPDQLVNKGFFDQAQKFFVAQKLLAGPIDLDRLIDPSFAQAAVAKLGPYRKAS